MKKFFAFVLALALTCALAVTCFAAAAPATGEVKATYAAGATDNTKVYSVDVTFGDMNFTYTDAGTGTWNPETHEYASGAAASWNKTTADITVKNHSNDAVAVTVSYAKDAEYTGAVTGSISEGTFTLATAVGTAVENAPAKTVTFTISGAPVAGVNNTTVGTITVTIAAAQ